MRIVLILLLFYPLVTPAQKITVEQDKFLKYKRVETGWCFLKQTLFERLALKIRAADAAVFLTIGGGSTGADVIGDKDQAIFLLDNDSTVTVYSTGVQSYDITTNGKSFAHQYSITKDDLAILQEHVITSIRKYGTDTYTDFDIPEKNAKRFQDLVKRFLKEIH